MLFLVLVASSFAGGLNDDPDYQRYLDAVHNLGTPVAIPGWGGLTVRNPVGTQMMPGLAGVIGPSGMDGWAACAFHPTNNTKFVETLVVAAEATIVSLEDTDHTLSYGSNLISATTAGLDAHLADLEDGGAGGLYRAAEFEITNKTIPKNATSTNLELMAVTPLTNPGEIELYGFRIKQGGVTTGWLLREWHDLGDGEEMYIDHWFYDKAYVPLQNALSPQLSIEFESTYVTIPSFVSAVSVDTALDPANPLVRYQQGEYSYVPLADLVP